MQPRCFEGALDVFIVFSPAQEFCFCNYFLVSFLVVLELLLVLQSVMSPNFIKGFSCLGPFRSTKESGPASFPLADSLLVNVSDGMTETRRCHV